MVADRYNGTQRWVAVSFRGHDKARLMGVVPSTFQVVY